MAAAGLLITACTAACTVTYHDPFGGTLTIEVPDDPTPKECVELYRQLEDEMKMALGLNATLSVRELRTAKSKLAKKCGRRGPGKKGPKAK